MMSFLEIKPEPLGEEVDGSHDEHLNERVNDFSKICFDYEDPDQDKIPIKEEIKEEIKHEPMTIDNMDDDLHVIDVENDQEKSELQSIIDKLLIEKHMLQKDIDKLVELQVENQILKSEKRLLEYKIKTFEELQVENQTLKSEKQYMERKLEEKEKKFQELSLHSAQLQSTILNLKENEDNHPKKLDKSDITQNMENCEANEEEPAVLQGEEFNISDPMTSSNCSNSGTTESQSTEFAGETVEVTKEAEKDSKEAKQFQKSQEKHHENISTPIKRKPKQCNICNKFVVNVNRHFKTVHEKRRDHHCENCGKDFALESSLKIHMHTIHEGQKDYKCHLCDRSFSQPAHLKKHIKRVHEGLRKYKCATCDKAFTENFTLKMHIQSVHEKIKHQCEICGKLFSLKAELKKHVKKVHEGQKNSLEK